MSMKRPALEAPSISAAAFWDVDFEYIDFENNSVFVLSKVFNYGTWNDIVGVLKYYGIKRVKKEVVQVPYFKKTTLAFLCTVLDLKKKDFKAYQRRQSQKNYWKQ